MISMTGFGSAKAATTKNEYEVSVRTVNGRFLELRFHFPRELHFLEGEVRKIAEKKFSRGTIDIFAFKRKRAGHSDIKISIDQTVMKQYQSVLSSVKKTLNSKEDLSVDLFARLPELLQIETQNQFDGKDKTEFLKVVKKAFDSCFIERVREGKSLRVDIEKKLSQLKVVVNSMFELREIVATDLQHKYQEKIKQRLQLIKKEANQEILIDQNRLSFEVGLLLEKADIAEEISRLNEHLRNYSDLATGKNSMGKSLDFYTQELLREINTIGSKSALSKMTQLVVQAKTLVEQLREQVQNIE